MQKSGTAFSKQHACRPHRNVDLDIGHVERFYTRWRNLFTAYPTHKKMRELRMNLLALLKQLLNEVKGGVGDKCSWDDSRQVKTIKVLNQSLNQASYHPWKVSLLAVSTRSIQFKEKNIRKIKYFACQ